MLLFDDDRWCGNEASVSGPDSNLFLAVNMSGAQIAVTPAVFYDQVIRRSSCDCIKQGCVGTTRTLNP
jgi:hypothetical protein